jgi:CheY-specific phosphatase CheX
MSESQQTINIITADFITKEFLTVFQRVWDTSIALPVKSLDSTSTECYNYPCCGAVAWIGGSWTGNLRIVMPCELAAVIAGRMLQIGVPSDQQIHDALRELANMLAGNLKSILPGRCGLATPGSFIVFSESEIDDEFTPILRGCYQSCEMPLYVTLNSLHQ